MPTLLFEKRPDGIALITLNQPDRMNALSRDMNQSLRTALADCAKDPAVRCVVLTGTDRAFCVGADIKGMNERQSASPVKGDSMEDFHERVRGVREGQEAGPLLLHTMPKPTVAVVNGYAIGLGLSLALGCDIRLAGSAAKLSTGYRNLALAGDYGGTYFLSKLVGDGIARELLFTGEMMDAERARALGIVNRVYPQAELMDKAMEFCLALAEGPTLAMALVKENLAAFAALSMKDSFDFEARNMILGMKSADHFEAVRAFAEKRRPVFKGR
jgi:2-(1,2-epoxy-1,2-dihydrophenyl)acetyl-CoA isomerase